MKVLIGMKERIEPRGVSKPVGLYSHVVKVTNPKAIVFVAGQVPVNDHGEIVGVEEIERFRNDVHIDLEEQVRQTLTNIKNALSDAGATMSDIVRLNTYVVSGVMNEYREIRLKLRKEFFAGVYPPGATVAVVSLMPSHAMIEIEAIAVID